VTPADETKVRIRLVGPLRVYVDGRRVADAPAGRAASLLAMPGNAPAALRTTARTVDAMWHAAGDNSADFSWYTRRATLAGIYVATLAWWLRDSDPGISGAMAFLDRRLADLGRFQKCQKRLRRAA
jgi:ubiquinone biosynthesis protein COQ9